MFTHHCHAHMTYYVCLQADLLIVLCIHVERGAGPMERIYYLYMCSCILFILRVILFLTKTFFASCPAYG